MAVKIIVDSTCDLSLGEIDRLGLLRAPLTVNWDGQQYLDGVDILPEEFYIRLAASSTLPTTSQVPVSIFEDLFHKVLEDGDEAVVMVLSHNLSGTYQSAAIARDGLETGSDSIHLMDTGSGSLGSMLLVYEAVKLRDSGCTASQIIDQLTSARDRLCILACVETLKYLHKGGRLSTGAAVIGTLLSVKPVLCVEDGKISVSTKVRGNNAAYQWIANHLAEQGTDTAYPIIIGSSQCPELVAQCTAAIKSKTELRCDNYCDIGTVIGTHVGPGAVAIAFIKTAN